MHNFRCALQQDAKHGCSYIERDTHKDKKSQESNCLLPLCSGVHCFVIPTGKTFHGMTTPAEKLSYSILLLNSQSLRENHGHNSKTGESRQFKTGSRQFEADAGV